MPSSFSATTGLRSGGRGGTDIQAMIDRIARFEPQLKDVLNRVLTHEAAKLEAYMKTEAPWTDQTGNARNGLYARVVEDFSRSGGGRFSGGTTFRIELGHRVPYGVWLEITERPHGRTARPIVRPTIRDKSVNVMAALNGVFGQVR